MLRRITPVLALIVFPLAAACASEPPSPTPDIRATVIAVMEALSTPTPYPTPTALPTHTPAPTPTAVIRQDNWRTDGLGDRVALGTGPDSGTWILNLSCTTEGAPGAFLWHSAYAIFSATSPNDDELSVEFDDALLVEFDGDAREQTWSYIPPGEDHNDYYSALWPDLFINLLMESSEVVFTVPTEGRPYVITFPVAGLDQHISAPGDLCEE